MIDSDQHIRKTQKRQVSTIVNLTNGLADYGRVGTRLAIYPGEANNLEATMSELKMYSLSEMKEKTKVCPQCSREVDSFGRSFGDKINLTDNSEIKTCNDCRHSVLTKERVI